MPLYDRRLGSVNAPIAGSTIIRGEYTEVEAVRLTHRPDGSTEYDLHEQEFWLPVGLSHNKIDRVAGSGTDENVTFTLDTPDRAVVRIVPALNDKQQPIDIEPSLVVQTEGDSTIIAGEMSCFEYEHTADQIGEVRLHCIAEPKFANGYGARLLAMEHYDIDKMRKRLIKKTGKDYEAEIRKFAKRVVDSVPEFVYHKCSYETFLATMNDKKYLKMSSDTPRVVKHRYMSTSDTHLPGRRLKTPLHNQEVTLKLRVPKTACPMRVVYNAPASHRRMNNYPDQYRLYTSETQALMDSLFTAIYLEELRKKHPSCGCVGELDIERQVKLEPYVYEREILLVGEDGNYIHIDHDDVVEIIAEGECGKSADALREAMREFGWDHLIPRVRDSEFCELVNLLSNGEYKRMLDEDKSWMSERTDWEWDIQVPEEEIVV